MFVKPFPRAPFDRLDLSAATRHTCACLVHKHPSRSVNLLISVIDALGKTRPSPAKGESTIIYNPFPPSIDVLSCTFLSLWQLYCKDRIELSALFEKGRINPSPTLPSPRYSMSTISKMCPPPVLPGRPPPTPSTRPPALTPHPPSTSSRSHSQLGSLVRRFPFLSWKLYSQRHQAPLKRRRTRREGVFAAQTGGRGLLTHNTFQAPLADKCMCAHRAARKIK